MSETNGLWGEWDAWTGLVDPQIFDAKSKKVFRKHLQRVGAMGVGLMREAINRKEYAPNAPATVKRKGFDHPLVETGVLRNEITYRFVETESGIPDIFFGIVGDSDRYEIGIILHEGTPTIPSRPFVDQVVNGREFTSRYVKILDEALQECFK